MFKHIFSFELKYRIKRPGTWAYFGILLLFGFITGINGGGPGSEKAFANSAFSVTNIIGIMSIFATLIASAVMGVPVYRDIEHRTKNYFFTYPFNEKDYLLGRYLGSLLILFLVTFGLHIGLILGYAMGPFIGLEEAEQFTGLNLWHYLQPTFTLLWPNLIFTGTLFFALVVLTRKIFVTYVASLLFFIAYLLSQTFTQDLDNQTLVNLLDPFGLGALGNASKYWTPLEQNISLVPFSGEFLWNRLLWVGLALLILGFTLYRFKFVQMMETKSGKKKKGVSAPAMNKVKITLPKVDQIFSNQVFFQKMFQLASLEYKNIVKDIYFIVIMLGAVIFLVLDAWLGNSTFGTPDLPLTYLMIEAKDNTYLIFVFIIITFYTGEVVHRDKSVNYSNIADALPVPNWLMYGAKFLSLVYVCFLLVSIVIVTGVFHQLVKGYTDIDFGMYFYDLYLITLPDYIQLVMLAFFIHILVNKKFLGHVVAIGIWLAMFGIQIISQLNYNMLFYGNNPDYRISDMNGFGHFKVSLMWFDIYWLALGAVLLVIGNLFWNRGSESSFKSRIKVAKQRLNSYSTGGLIAFALLWIASGSFIYYNVSVLNEYTTADERELQQVEYEKKYKKYEFAIQPTVTGVKVNVDIFPNERKTLAKGEFIIVNKSDQPIDTLHLLSASPINGAEMKVLTVDGEKLNLVMEDKDLQYSIYTMPKTMQPQDTMVMNVTIDAAYKGFPNSGFGRQIVYNGTFFNMGIFPSFGYNSQAEINSDSDRKKHGLPKKDYSAPPQDDAYGLSHLLFNDDAEYVTFEAVVSTEADQIAIAPGYLQKEWEEGGRKYYHYKMTSEMDLFFNFSSARYAVSKDVWKGDNGEEVNIEIYHHPSHDYNVDRFTKSVQRSMDYYNTNFSPYQYKQMRILEFPRYAGFAQSFPNTVPYTESFGWIGDFSDPEDTDYAFYVTAHEVAHQWWGHQITPSLTRGANQISETMAEYSALMVLKKEYGNESMQRFLKYSLDRYLRGRAGESKFEKTLLDNDTQSYVWYRKGSVILYALQDYVGEEALNQVFSEFLDTAAFRPEPPFATSNEWYSYIQKATPDSLKYFIEDSFEKITLYENRTLKAEYEKQDNGEYKVTLQVKTDKAYYKGTGEEISRGGDQKNLIEIGIFAEDGKNERGMSKKTPLYLKKMWLAPGEHTLEFTVAELPKKAGIDPYNKLIDRVSDDNLINVEEK